jgi:cytochrome P450
MSEQAPPNILSPEFAVDPYSAYQRLREDFPLLHYPDLGWYVLSRYKDVERAAKDPVFSTENYGPQLEPLYGDRTMMQMDGREHTQYRGMVQQSFRGRELFDRFLPMIERLSSDLIEQNLVGQGEVDFLPAFASQLPIQVTVRILGLPMSDVPHFRRWYQAFVAGIANLGQDPAITATATEAKMELEAYMMPKIVEKRANPEDDLLSALAVAEIDGVRMNDSEIRAFVSLLLVAGGETTEKALTSLMANFSEHPDQLEALRRDPSLVEAALAETLRFTPPVQMIMRLTREPVEMSGGTIPAGAFTILLIGAANRDPRQYKNPEQFNMLRPDLDVKNAFTAAGNHMAFGSGRHYCVGAQLAKIEMTLALNHLLEKSKTWKVTQPPQWAGTFTRAPEALMMQFQ